MGPPGDPDPPKVLGPRGVLGPHGVLGPRRAVGPYSVLSPHRVLGPVFLVCQIKISFIKKEYAHTLNSKKLRISYFILLKAYPH